MPAEHVLRDPVVSAAPDGFDGWSDDVILQMAARFGVSGEAVLRRLVDLGKAPWALYHERRSEWQEIYAGADERRAGTGGSYYRTHVRNLGKGYVRLVMDAYASRAINSYEAASFLNAKVASIPGLAKAARAVGEA
jgi:Zn-dependent peptidase ImmA (M78 family)